MADIKWETIGWLDEEEWAGWGVEDDLTLHGLAPSPGPWTLTPLSPIDRPRAADVWSALFGPSLVDSSILVDLHLIRGEE